MSQTPNEPRDNNLGDSASSADNSDAVKPATSEPTVNLPHVAASDQPTNAYPRVSGQPEQSPASGPGSYAQPAASSQNLYGAHSAGQPQHAYSNPYSQPEGNQHNYPVPPEKKPKQKKSYSSATLISGMVAAALVGGLAAAGTNYFLADSNTTAATTSSSTSQGVVINNPDSVTEVTAAAAKASPSVVTIEVSGNSTSGSGSGIILDTDGHILTNTHVVTLGGEVANPTISVQTNDGQVYSATVVGTDPTSDLAVIKIDAQNLTPATLGDSDDLNVGDAAVAIGAPLGLSGTVTDGIISTLNRTISIASSAAPEQDSTDSNDNNGGQFNFQFPGESEQQQQQSTSSSGTIYVNVIQTDAAINHGNSGGALVNANGEVIGVNVAIASSGDSEDGGSIGVGFAIPINYAQRIANELIANGEATHGLLGATVQATAAQTDASGTSTSTFSVGATIVDVTSGSAADKAGLKSGDVITAVNGRTVQDSQTVTAAIREIAAGGEAKITYLRNGQENTVTATVGQLSDN